MRGLRLRAVEAGVVDGDVFRSQDGVRLQAAFEGHPWHRRLAERRALIRGLEASAP